jgi:hypothetical protein
MLAYAEPRTTTYIKNHSPSVDCARELAGSERIIDRMGNDDSFLLVFNVTPEIIKTFRPERVTQCLIGDYVIDCAHTFTVAGSQATRTKNDWLADYFGLPTDFHSLVYLRPRVTQGVVNFWLHAGFDPWCPGLYARAYLTLAHVRFDLNMCERVLNHGSQGYDAGYFSPHAVERDQLLTDFTEFITGSNTPTIEGVQFDAITNAKMNCTSNRATHVAEATFSLGYVPWHTDIYHLGFDLRFAIPAGNRPRGDYLFEAIVGNGHHYEFGGGLSAHCILWQCEDTDEQVGLYFDAEITHLFKTRQRRSFDLTGSSNSRYQLAATFDAPSATTGNLRGQVGTTLIAPDYHMSGGYVPVANLTTYNVDVSVGVQADVALAFIYSKGSRSFLFGYGYWGQSCEHICITQQTAFSGAQKYALKGDAMMFGFENTAGNPPVALSASERQATISHGTNFSPRGARTPEQVATGQTNPNIDNPYLAFADTQNSSTFNPVMSAPGGINQINTSINPVILTPADIDIDSARTAPHVQKVFAQVSFFGDPITCFFYPYAGLGAEVEFGRPGCVPPPNEKPSCINCALSSWNVWLKIGFVFDV